jgi:hypothetical protein
MPALPKSPNVHLVDERLDRSFLGVLRQNLDHALSVQVSQLPDDALERFCMVGRQIVWMYPAFLADLHLVDFVRGLAHVVLLP